MCVQEESHYPSSSRPYSMDSGNRIPIARNSQNQIIYRSEFSLDQVQHEFSIHCKITLAAHLPYTSKRDIENRLRVSGKLFLTYRTWGKIKKKPPLATSSYLGGMNSVGYNSFNPKATNDGCIRKHNLETRLMLI